MSRAIDGLFERGLVEREEDPDDRRMKRVRLTACRRRRSRGASTRRRLSALPDLVASLDDEQAQALSHAAALILGSREDIAAYRPQAQAGHRERQDQRRCG